MFLSYNEYFSIVSILVVVVALISLIVGFKKGFMSRIVGVVRLIISLVAAFFGSGLLKGVILNTSQASTVESKILTFIKNRDFFKDASSNQELLSKLWIPEALKNKISLGADLNQTASNIASSLTGLLAVVIAFVVIFIAVFIIMTVVCRIFEGVRDLPILGVFDGILGMVYSLLVCALVVCLVFVGLSFAIRIDVVNNFISSDFALDSDKFRISKFIYDNNPIILLFNNIFN